jgi:hypothetical protein
MAGQHGFEAVLVINIGTEKGNRQTLEKTHSVAPANKNRASGLAWES